MIVGENVTVGMVDDKPKYILWHGRNHTVTQIGFHHTLRQGRSLYHIFSVISGTLFMKLKFNTDNLVWRLEEISE